MDIGLIHPELIYPRGAEKQVCMLSHYLTKFGHEVTIYTFEKKEPYIYDHLLENVEVYTLGKKWSVGLPAIDVFRWLILLKKISNNYKLKTHDILNSHNAPAHWIANFTKKTVIWSCNEPYLYYIGNNRVKAFYSPFILMDKFLSRRVSLILCLDPMMEKIIRKRYPNIKTVVSWSGVDLNYKVEHIENDILDVLFVGPIHSQKRPLDIVKSFANLRDDIDLSKLKLHFVGEILMKDLKEKMELLAKQYSINIHFYGYVSTETLCKLYNVADLAIFVPEMQPWGIFPLEAILAGVPTIISDQCGVKYILPSDFPIVETGNVKQLSDRILDIIKNYDLYRKITKTVAEKISKEYSWENYSKRLESVFRSILDGEKL